MVLKATEGQLGVMEKDSGQRQLDRSTLRARAFEETSRLAEEVSLAVSLFQSRTGTSLAIGDLFTLDAETADCFQ